MDDPIEYKSHVHTAIVKERIAGCGVCDEKATHVICVRTKIDNEDHSMNLWLCEVHYIEAVTPVDHEEGNRRNNERWA